MKYLMAAAIVILCASSALANPSAEKICEKHPTWAMATCQRLSNKEVWIGMTWDEWREAKRLPHQWVSTTHGRNGSRIDVVKYQEWSGNWKWFTFVNNRLDHWSEHPY